MFKTVQDESWRSPPRRSPIFLEIQGRFSMYALRFYMYRLNM
jgi:hypothetical protein